AVVAPVERLMGNDMSYSDALGRIRAEQEVARQSNPATHTAGQVGGGLAVGLAAGPASLTARAGSTLLPRMGVGALEGLAFGGAYGAGSGTDAQSRAIEALKTGALGAVAGGLFPVFATGAGKAYEGIRNYFRANPIAREAGASPETLRTLGNVLSADDALGP